MGDTGTGEALVKVQKVLYVPELAGNLLSVAQLVEKGARLEFNHEGCTLTHQGRRLGIAKQQGKLYCFFAGQQEQDDGVIWHERLGHPGLQAMRQLLKGEYVKGLPKGVEAPEGICEGCQKGKQARKVFPATAKKQETEALALTHMDLCGPMQVETFGGARYMMMMVDDATRHKTVFLLKDKAEAAANIKFYQKAMEAALNKQMREIRTDRGGEFVNRELSTYLAEHGIRHNLTAPYSPQQNGVAERANRTIMEAARSMLHARGVDYRLWGEAVRTAAKLRNLMPGKKQGKSPSELFWGEKPNVSYLRVWGCRAFVHTPNDRRKKLDPKSLTCIFVGYEANCKAWRFWHPPTKSLIISRDAVFDEGQTVGWQEVTRDPFMKELDGGDDIAMVPTVPQPPVVVPARIEAAPPRQQGEREPQQHQQQVNQPPQVQQQEAPRAVERGGIPKQQVAGWDEGEGLLPNKVRSMAEILEQGAVMAYLGANLPVGVPRSYQEAMGSPEAAQWQRAMEDEMSSIISNNTWVLAPLPAGRKAVGCKWVYALKKDERGNILRFKARLVAKGYSQRPGEDYAETFAPVAKFATVRVLLTLAAQREWPVDHLDVKTAFLHGVLQEEIFMEQPQGFEVEGGACCKLVKSLYGLKQASRAWYERLRGELLGLGLQGADEDPSLFYTNDRGVFLLVYVDDMLLMGDQDAMQEIKRGLAKKFTLSDLGEAKFFLGLELQWDRGNRQVRVKQERYAEEVLNRFEARMLRPASTPLPPGVKLQPGEVGCPIEKFQSAVGSLMYLGTSTRPDICFAIGAVSRYLTCPTREHWQLVTHILRYLSKTRGVSLVLGADKDGGVGLIGWSDADWGANDDTRRSISGYVYKMGAGAVTWGSKRQHTVALSSTEAEYLALTRASKEALWLQRLLGEISGRHVDLSPSMWTTSGALQRRRIQRAMRGQSTSTFRCISSVHTWQRNGSCCSIAQRLR
jgi:hypothetical protein